MYRYIMTSTVVPQLDYAVKQISHPTYQFSRSSPQVSTPPSLGTSSQETIFELPPRVMNLAQCFILHDYTRCKRCKYFSEALSNRSSDCVFLFSQAASRCMWYGVS